MSLTLPDLLILSIATWRLAYLLTHENGPFHAVAALRDHFPLGGLMTCLRCASVWCALALVLVWLTPLQPAVYVLAVSGAALMLGAYSGAGYNGAQP